MRFDFAPHNKASVAVISSYLRSVMNSTSTGSFSLPRRLSSRTTLSARTKSRGAAASRPISFAMLAIADWIFSQFSGDADASNRERTRSLARANN